MLDLRARKNVSRAADPVARLLGRIGLSPTLVTLAGLAFSIAGAVLIALGHLTWGAGTLGFGAVLDVLDGVLARLTGTETVRGAFLDSFTDRVGEVAAWTGLAFYLGERAEAALVTLSIVAVCGSLLIPYVRSRAEALGVDGRGGLLGRAERLLAFGFGIGLAGLGLPTLEATIWILAVGTWLTVVQRFAQTWRRLAS
ncbi:MAG: CDP-alcohol phosphatidyltransferase family protein [Acidimicrobiia bacterium]|nr:MAG: CDP-alcohol phosphatidyltransferase family protein [Acidimicrobiia bacterium]